MKVGGKARSRGDRLRQARAAYDLWQQSPEPHEADAARVRYEALKAKYGFTDAEVQARGVRNPIEALDKARVDIAEGWEPMLAGACAQFMRCVFGWSPGMPTGLFVGEGAAPAASAKLFVRVRDGLRRLYPDPDAPKNIEDRPFLLELQELRDAAGLTRFTFFVSAVARVDMRLAELAFDRTMSRDPSRERALTVLGPLERFRNAVIEASKALEKRQEPEPTEPAGQADPDPGDTVSFDPDGHIAGDMVTIPLARPAAPSWLMIAETVLGATRL